MQSDTAINGGLVMSNVVAVRSGNGNTEEDIVAGMSGLKDDGVFFFADVKNAYRKAVNYFKGLSADKPLFGVAKNGFFVAMSGLIGCFQVAKDLITIKDASGADKVKFTGKSIEEFASQAQSSSGGSTGSQWSKQSSSGTLMSGTDTQVMLSHSFTNNGASIFSVASKQNLTLMTQVANDVIGGSASARANVSVRFVLKMTSGSTVLLERTLQNVTHDCYTDEMSVTGQGNTMESSNVVIDYSFSERLPAGSIKIELLAVIGYSMSSMRGPSGAYSSSVSWLTPQSGGRFDFVSTDDETILGSDGMSVRLNSNNFFKLLKKAGELNFIFKGLVSPDSNIPALITGGQVGSSGNKQLQIAGTYMVSRIGVGSYRIILPDYMAGKDNYVVMLTGCFCDNMITLDGKFPSSNYFQVKTWQSPGNTEDATFGFMVYRAK
ncbi:MAG: hypothetical protein ACRCR3_10385, partial [Tannerellaceae bacterium]